MFSSMLLESTGFFQQYWIVFVLLALIIVLYIVSAVRRKKYNEQNQQMLNDLKPGVKVKTYSGIYGKIVSIKETTDGKVVLLELGEGSKTSYMSVDANAIFGVDQKEDVVYDKDGNIIEKDSKDKEVKEEKDKAVAELEKLEESEKEAFEFMLDCVTVKFFSHVSLFC